MLIYIHEHYSSKITISEIATAAHISERECFRVFREGMYITPINYLKSIDYKRLAIRIIIITIKLIPCIFSKTSYFLYYPDIYYDIGYVSPYYYKISSQTNYYFKSHTHITDICRTVTQ